jgi:hypothetical protein
MPIQDRIGHAICTLSQRRRDVLVVVERDHWLGTIEWFREGPSVIL